MVLDYFDPKNIFNNDINETYFEFKIIDKKKNEFNANCEFWKPKDEKVRLICKINEKLNNNYIMLSNGTNFKYNDYSITIYSDDYIEVEQLNNDIPFLYSDKQIININDKDENYYLKFKVSSYNNEILYLNGTDKYNLIKIDECNKEKNELICKIKKENIEEIIQTKEKAFKLIYFNFQTEISVFDNVLDILIIPLNYEKKDIYINITKSLFKDEESLYYFATYETDVTDISNFISEKFAFKPLIFDFCFFRKYSEKPLLLLCKPSNVGENFLGNIDKEIIYDNITSKYNLRIKPVNNFNRFYYKGDYLYSNIYILYPTILNLTSDEDQYIYYTGLCWPNYAIKINPGSDKYLSCNCFDDFYRCNIDKNHFKNYLSGYYYLYVDNIFIYGLSPVHIILPENNNIYLQITYHFNGPSIMSYNKSIIFLTNYNDKQRNIFDINDIEDLTKFESKIIDDNNNEYIANCRLWKLQNESIYIICDLNTNLKYESQQIKFNNESPFKYKNYSIDIEQEEGYIRLKKSDIPLIYSNNQIIKVNDEQETYNLKFKCESYNSDILYKFYIYGTGYNNAILDKCDIKDKELNCEISKTKIEEILRHNNDIFHIEAFNDDIGVILLNYTSDIVFNYEISKKEDIFIKIIKPLTSFARVNVPFPYEIETNTSSIPNIVTDKYNKIFFKKSNNNPLMLFVEVNNQEDFVFEKITSEKILDNIHYKYNFRIQPYESEKTIYIGGSKPRINLIDPEELDFNEKDSLIIRFFVDDTSNIYSLGFSEYRDSLDFVELNKMIKCTVPLSYFHKQNSSEKYYYTNFTAIEINYYLPRVKVIKPKNSININIYEKDNKEKIFLGQNGLIYFTTNYIDEKNIFKTSDMEEKIKFSAKIKTQKDEIYKLNCKFWNPINETLRIFCNMEEMISTNFLIESINFDEFKYNNYTFIIKSEYLGLNVIVSNKILPFLYANKQTINVNDQQTSYNLKFKYEVYNNDILYIYSVLYTFETLDNCDKRENELICEISKEKIEEILFNNNYKFHIGVINDDVGIIQLHNILDITINYEIAKKEDIIVNIIKPINLYVETQTPIAFEIETEPKNIPNLVTDFFINSYFFKKTTGNPLRLFLHNYHLDDFVFNKITEEIILDDIHYKYNFRIQPYEKDEKITVKGMGSRIVYIYPKEFNLIEKNSLIIRYITKNPQYIKNLRLYPTAPDLECTDLNMMKKCTISLNYFLKNNIYDKYYYTYYLNNTGSLSIFYDLPMINVTLPSKEDIIDIFVRDNDNIGSYYVGEKGMLFFIGDYSDSETKIFTPSGIEEKIVFNTSVTDENYNNYDVTCKLWQPLNEKIRIICKLYKNIIVDGYYTYIKLNSASTMFNNKMISIISEMSLESYYLRVYNVPIPFVYAGKQEINVEDGKNIYELKFKIGEYNNELLVLMYPDTNRYSNLLLEKCQINNEYLICELTKEQIEEKLFTNVKKYELNYYYESYGETVELPSVLEITINYKINKKENINVDIKKLLQKNVDRKNYIAFETSVVSISDIVSDYFKITTDVIDDMNCFFKKSPEKPLLLLCLKGGRDTFYLGEIKEVIKLENINVKYNFYIQKGKNTEEITVSGDGGHLFHIYPSVLNFYSNDMITINYIGHDVDDLKNMRINPDSTDLDCIETKSGDSLRCKVPKSHFNGKKGGYYYNYHLDFNNDYTPIYEISPVKIILPTGGELVLRIKNSDVIKLGQKGAILFITDYDDNTENKFNPSDIEEKTKFKAKFKGGDKNYDAECKLWKPKNEKIRLICKFNENILSSQISLDKHELKYNEQNIGIFSEEDITINQINSNMALLYSDPQVINLDNNNNDYSLIFNKGVYNNEPLILYKDLTKNTKLTCKEVSGKIKCDIKKNDFVKILTSSGEIYNLVQFVESEGILLFDNVFEITVNYQNVQKININLNITKLLTPYVEKNGYLIYETDMKDIPPIITNSFNLIHNRNDNDLNCLFKKINDNDNLLIFCEAPKLDTFTLGLVSNIDLVDINILYNFKIEKSQNDEVSTISKEEGPKVYMVSPNELNFNSKDSLIINYRVENPEKLKGLKLNNDSESELECIDKNEIKQCTIPKSHFNESGEYYTYCLNSANSRVILYEVEKIKIILEGETPSGGNGDKMSNEKSYVGIIVGASVGGVVLIVILVFLICKCRKKNSENDFSKSANLMPESIQVELKEELN